ncbi:MAG TPA: HD domain-containing phosphohydrolase [Tepidisphaeraceae bacterium]|nr:HD domain-containing phosphohydrolase [Tepidisphaeraceae bacterium]
MTSVPLAELALAPLLQALPCGAALLSRDGRIDHANERLCAMMGRAPADVIGASLLSICAPDAEAREPVRRLLEHFEQPHEEEFYLPLPDGSRLPVLASARAVTGDERPAYRLVTIIDLSRQKKSEEELRSQYQIVAQLGNTFLGQAENLKKYSQLLEDRVTERTAELREANLDAIYMLAVACEAKDEDTGRHVRRIRDYAEAMARELGFEARDAESIGYSAVLHDVGKLHVPDHILKKPTALTDEERLIVQQHTLAGERILSDKPFFRKARLIARGHHENWDGSGYPDTAAREAIPVEARIVHLADVFDALTSPRAYKHAWAAADAAGVIRESSGRMFDPEIVRAFESLFARGALPRA